MTTLPGPLVDATWLAEHLDASDLRVLEATAYLDPPSQPGKAYDLRIEYYNGGDRGVLSLLWSSPTRKEEPVPASAFRRD